MIDGALRRALHIAFVVWIAAFVGFLGTTITTYHEPLRVLGFWAYGAPTVATAAYCLSRRVTRVDIAVLIAVAGSLVVAWLSTDPTASFESAGLGVAYASTVIVAGRVVAPRTRSLVAIGVTLPVTVWLLILVATWIVDRIEWVTLGGGVPPLALQSAHMWLGTDLVAALLLIAIPFYGWISWKALRNVLIASTALAAIAIVPITDARTAWIATVLGGAVLLWLTPSVRHRIWPAHRLPLLAASGVLVMAGVVVIGSGVLGTISGRTHIWTMAVTTFADNPFSGTGQGTFSWARLAAAPPLLEPYPVFQAHNFVLHTLAEGGAILLVVLVMACAVGVATMLPSLLSLRATTRVAVSVLAAVGLLMLFDDPLQLPALAALVLVLSGWVIADASARRPGPRYRGSVRIVAAAALIAAGLVTVPATISASAARTAAAAARTAAVDGDWESADVAFARAAERWPTRAAYQLGLGLSSAHLGDADAAKAHYGSAARLAPGDPRARGALASLTNGDDEAIGLLRDAAQMTSRDPQYRYRLALELREAGRHDETATELARAVMIDPQVLAVIANEWPDGTLDAVTDAMPSLLAQEARLLDVDPASVAAQVDVILGRIEEANPPALVALGASRLRDHQLAGEQMDIALRHEAHAARTYDVGTVIAEARCDEAEAHRLGQLRLITAGGFTSLYGIGDEIRESRDHIYREMGLGDYQPPGVERPNVSPYSWPRAFVAGIGCVKTDPS